jgi:hypothetical protein
MKKLVALLILLAGCTSAKVPAPVVSIPSDLEDCPSGARIPFLPPKPRTIEAVAAWGNRNEMALRRTLAALEICDRKRAEALLLIKR